MKPVLKFTLPQRKRVVFKVINVSGQVVLNFEKVFEKGAHTLPLDLRKSGVYFVSFKTKEGIEKTKFILLK